MSTPKISIIVPIYNVEKYLCRCIESLINQSLKNIEIILVDDGSPDNCPQICDEYSLIDSRIKVIHKQNAGLGFARNTGLEIATGEYIAFVDSDDYVELNMYEKLYTLAKKNNNDIIFCGFKKEFQPNNYLFIKECDNYTEYKGEKEVKKLIPDFIAAPPYSRNEYIHDMSVWHSIYRRSIITKNNISFISERDYVSEDIPFQVEILNHCNNIAFIPDTLYIYCYNQGSLTKSFNISKFEKIKKLYYLLSQKAEEHDKQAIRTKRLFIGYTRTIIRQIVTLDIDKKTKLNYITTIVNDNIWNEIKRIYKPSYLPIHQRIMTYLIYRKYVSFIYTYGKFMNTNILTAIKSWGGVIFLILYYGFAQYLPNSYSPLFGKLSNKIRIFCVKRIFKKCGKVTTINRKANFGNGSNIEIGDYSGIGENCIIPNNIIIGKYVMMGPDVYILSNNHNFKDLHTPMCFQGYTNTKQTVIEDDCWIGGRVIMTAGRYIKKGSIIGTGCVLTKDFEEYSIIGGNPGKLIKKRSNENSINN